MSLVIKNLPCSNSSITYFVEWASSISQQLSAAGWTQTADTGQVNWSTISSVPGSNTYVYEIWQPNDGLTNFYFKIEYGSSYWSSVPALRLSVSDSTTGTGVLNGNVTSLFETVCQNNMPTSTLPLPCYFSYENGRFNCMLWSGITAETVFGIERSRTTSGTYTGNYITLLCAGFYQNQSQQSLWMGVGVPPYQGAYGYTVGYSQNNGFWNARFPFVILPDTINVLYDNQIMVDFVAPCVGYFDVPVTMFGFTSAFNTANMQQVSSINGHQYLVLNMGYSGLSGAYSIEDVSFVMRID
ncbi:Uncharacterised protein [uncultured archaeon]|nr:Uncharacterised protein [uncultured archaeon]